MRRRLGATLALLVLAGCGGPGPTRSDASDVRVEVKPDAMDGGPGDGAAGAGDAIEAGADRDGSDAAGDTGDGPSDGTGDVAETSPDVTSDAGDGPDAWPNLCGKEIGTIKPTSAPVTGTLTGAGANSIVSCHVKGTGVTPGPDAFYTLVLDAIATIEVRVDAPADTVIAIRSGCADGISEVACSDGPRLDYPPRTPDAGALDAGPFDADSMAAVSDGPPLRNTVLRVRLAAGSYTVIVDSPAAGATIPYTLSARAVTLSSNAVCAAPKLLAPPVALSGEDLSLAGDSIPACSPGSQPALYYAVGVPSGQRLTARAVPPPGDLRWQPRIDAFAACGGTCLAQGHATSGAAQGVDWTNNGPNWRLVLLAVTSSAPVNDARFDLSVSIVDPVANCGRPTPVADGTTLLNQDLQRAPLSDGPTCQGQTARTLYYSATLLASQTLEVTALPAPAPAGVATGVVLSLRDTCADTTGCASSGQFATLTNTTDKPKTVLIEAQSTSAFASGLFDLHVSIPPPPAAVSVAPKNGLVTTEGGGTASFQVTLMSPPTAPVTIGVASDTPGEGKAAPASLQFDPTNWDQPQKVTVTGVDDAVSDGSRRYTIVTSKAMSTDARYAGLEVDDVSVTNLDDEPGFFYDGSEDLTTTEAGGTATFTVRLNHAPTDTVKLPLSSNDVGEGTVSPAELVFTTSDWSMPHTVTVTGVDDALTDGVQTYTIVVGKAVSTDAVYAGQDPPDVVMHNRDDDIKALGTTILSGDRACSGTQGRSVAVDAWGTIYVEMLCEGSILVTTSRDGGQTWGTPVVASDMTSDIDTVVIAAAEGGVAYLAFESSSFGLGFTRTTDGGATWEPPKALMTYSSPLRMVAARQTVIVDAGGPEGAPNNLLLRSFDAGQSFLPRIWIDQPNNALWLGADGQTLHAVDGQLALHKSTDGGATFSLVGTLPRNGNFGLTSQYLVVAENGFFSGFKLTNLDESFGFDSLLSNTFALETDDADNITILDGDANTGRLKVFRLPPGTMTFPQGQFIGPRVDFASAGVLSRKAVAAISVSGSLVLLNVVVWP